MLWVEKSLKEQLVPTPLPWAGPPITKAGYSEAHLRTPEGMGSPQLLWAICFNAS